MEGTTDVEGAPGSGGSGTNEVTVPVVPGYELGELLAGGATSEVWAGADVAVGRRVVVKVVHAALGAVEAAAREASVSARAASAHVVAVEACVPLPDGRVALVMPHLRGGALDGLVRARGHLAPGEVVTVLAPVASAIGRLHDLGVVHGDVSPGNVLLEPDGRPLLGDLGLSHVVGDVSPGVWGTDGYVAPEVVLGADPTPASDVYGLGALGWLCLTGEIPGPPGLRPPLAELCRADLAGTPLVRVLEAASAPEPEDRPTAHEVAWQLFQAADPQPLDLVRDDDPVSAVTYRLRAAAGCPPESEPPGRLTAALHALGRLHRRNGGSVHRHHRGAAVGPPGRQHPLRTGVPRRRGRHARHRAAWPRVATAAAGIGSALTALVLLGVLVLSVAALGGERRTAEARGVPGPPRSGADVGLRSPMVAVSTVSPDVRTDPSAPRQRPAELLEQLAGHRAAAWREGTTAHLHGSNAPHSSAAAMDAAAVAEMARAGVRYTGLRYLVREARVVTASSREALLEATIDTTAYVVKGPSGWTPRPAARADEMLVTLVWTDVGWRIDDVRAPES